MTGVSGNPDRQRCPDTEFTEADRLRLKSGAQQFRPLQRHCLRHARQQQQELLAAIAAGHVGGTRLLAQHRRQVLEDFVARLVAVGIVDALEMVEIDQHQAQRVPLALAVRQIAVHGGIEIAPVVETGQRVAVGLLAEPRLQGVDFIELAVQRLLAVAQLRPRFVQLDGAAVRGIGDHQQVKRQADDAEQGRRPVGVRRSRRKP